MNFLKFKKSLQNRLDFLIKNGELFILNVTRDELWNTYINSFSSKNNPIYITNTVHDGTYDKIWIRNYGGIVAIINGKLESLWDIECGKYQATADAMKSLTSKGIKDIFLTKEIFGKDSNVAVNQFKVVKNEDGTFSNTKIKCPKFGKTFNHFYYLFPNKFISSTVEASKAKVRDAKNVTERSFKELNPSSIDEVINLVNEKLLYRGEEFIERIKEFKKLQKKWIKSGQSELFCWTTAIKSGRVAAIRNSAIGTLLVDLSNGIYVEDAAKKYHAVMGNYKVPKAFVTEKMKKQALKKIKKLGIEDTLIRKMAFLDEIALKDVLWANGEAANIMQSPLEALKTTNTKTVKYNNAQEVSIDFFLNNVLPTTKDLQVQLTNKLVPNLCTLTSGKSGLFQWDNGFALDYNGGKADSGIKNAVKNAGGKVNGVLRFSIMWAENNGDNSDLDAHCRESKGKHIYYSTKISGVTGGNLDVDITRPKTQMPNGAVENITYPSLKRMVNGDYKFYVHQYNESNSKGFKAEIEFDGNVYYYEYNQAVKGNINVATVSLKNGKFTIKHDLPVAGSVTKEVWNLQTNDFVKVNTVMLSPNYWGYNKGNKHFLFMLEGCINPDSPRGFHNEHLRNDLVQFKKLFQALGQQMKVPYSKEQLSGLGFSSTLKESVIVKVDGRPLKINFNTKENIKFHSLNKIKANV